MSLSMRDSPAYVCSGAMYSAVRSRMDVFRVLWYVAGTPTDYEHPGDTSPQ